MEYNRGSIGGNFHTEQGRTTLSYPYPLQSTLPVVGIPVYRYFGRIVGNSNQCHDRTREKAVT